MYINIAKVDFGRYDSGGEPQLNGLYITPADASAISVTPNDSYYTIHGKYLKYSLNGKKWKDWNGSVTIKPEQKMYLKGEDDYVCNSPTRGKLITSDGYYNVGGDISSLTNFITEVKECTFYGLFYEDSYIKDASSLILPATTLATNCYDSMFFRCYSLTAVPSLPATTLSESCYELMFYECTSLTAAPELPATTLASWCYNNMFYGCSSLTAAPVLPATTLADNCYKYMFSGCSSLTTAPELPATTLAGGCYSSMFVGCTSLTAAPVLPATTLTDNCYNYMFSGCKKLTTTPVLPATTLANGCYSYMFYGCKSLTAAPELPATTLANDCYYNMFSRCYSLTTAPVLPATTLADFCYADMFNGCTSLTTAPALPATTLANYCYYSMFQGCTLLTTAPELQANTLTDYCYQDMFQGCTSLNNITMLATDISASNCLNNWVMNVSSTGTFTKSPEMTSLPTGVNGIPEGWTVVDYTEYMTLSALGDGEITITIPAEINSTYATSLSYSKDKSTWNETIIDDTAQTISIPVTSGENVYLKGIAKQLGKYNSFININASAGINASGNIMSLLYGDDYKDKVAFQAGSEYTFNNLFSGNTHLINAKYLVLPATTAASTCYYYMFNGCTSLTTAPALPATTLTNGCYRYMFQGCTSLTTAPELPATTLADWCYSNMFNGCTSLTTAPVLPATTLTNGCYDSMFNGCTSLTTAPELPATTLTYSCYSDMFYGCSSLNNITMLATDISASGCLLTWVYGVAPTGTFTKAAEMTTLPAGQSGIPEGWTVKDYGVVDYSQEYMTLSALGDGEITINIPAAINSSYATSLSYSKDKSTWNETLIDDTAQTINIPVTSGDNVYLKGIANKLGNSDVSASVNINSTADINASGNIMSLLYGDDYKDKVALPSGSSYTFGNLFRINKHLINAENIILPATTLTNNCYWYVFDECSSLTTAPALPATTLLDSCYRGMFQNCTALTTAPELPATTLANYCYNYMFQNCTALTTAPELPATTLANSCYNSMFNGCTSLTTAPELPATKLESFCYASMFGFCSKLNNITMLATDISAANCLFYWVMNVSSTGTFTKSPEMTTLPTGIHGIPDGWTVVDYGAVDYSQEYMTLSALGDGEITIIIPAAINSTYATSISYSKDKATWTETLIDDTEQTISITVTDGENVYLKGIAKQLGNSSTGVNINSNADINASGNIMSLLYGDNFKDKTSFPEGSQFTFLNLFNSNTHLISAENLILPATTLVTRCYQTMFRGCALLTTAPELPATTLIDHCYFKMFNKCNILTAAPSVLPATTLADWCYSSMFNGCFSLTTAPELPATTLVDNCYSNMFKSCHSLNNITMLATDISASNCLYYWVSGVSATGTFTKAPEMTSLPTGSSGIPDGWTVVDYGAA